MPPKAEVLQGTLDLLVLKTLDTLGPMHGFGIAQRIQQVSQGLLCLKSGHSLSCPVASRTTRLDFLHVACLRK